jgi:hypothetical protein
VEEEQQKKNKLKKNLAHNGSWQRFMVVFPTRDEELPEGESRVLRMLFLVG